jgi:hypothetical protein
MVTGIVLHVQPSDVETRCEMVYYKSRTAVVNIGRQSSGGDTDKKPGDTESNNSAMFKCPVISRRHAKIAFSDSGHVSTSYRLHLL